MLKTVYVVTNSELGWDNVIAVFDADMFTKEEVQRTFNSKYDYVDEKDIETSLEGWADEN